MMSAHVFAIDEVCGVAHEMISGPSRLGKILLGFREKRLKKQVRILVGLLYAFDPARADEHAFETVEECVSSVLEVLRRRATEPFFEEAIKLISEAANWIAKGYSPSHPPSEEELRISRDAAARRLSEALSTEHP